MIVAGTRARKLGAATLAGLALTLTALSARAQVVDSVRPREPENGAVTGPKPTFRIGLDGQDWTKVRYKIVLSRDGFRTEDFVFDQLKDETGWALTGLADDEKGAIYQVRQPLPDGEYQWRPFAWNGVEWVRSRDDAKLRVDTIPPASVEGLRIDYDPVRKGFRLAWEPVFTDRDGRPELVARYHVYRYQKRWYFSGARYWEIGVADDTEYFDADPVVLEPGLHFYQVFAEDAAGNQMEKKRY